MLRFLLTVAAVLCVVTSIGTATDSLKNDKHADSSIVDIDARFISVDALRIQWTGQRSNEVTKEDSEEVLLHLGIGESECENFVKSIAVEMFQQVYTFWRLTPGKAYIVCWRSDSPDWKTIRVSPGIHVPPGSATVSASSEVFEEGEGIILTCEASGNPKPRIFWYKDSSILVDGEEHGLTSEGRLTIRKAEKGAEGKYYCTASNHFGAALSRKVTLKMAELKPFHPDESAQEVVVAIGDGAQLKCHAPYSFPSPVILWERLESEDDRIPRRVKLDDRVAIGADGSLLFVYTKESDRGLYQCNVHNPRLDHGQAGSLTTLGLSGHPTLAYPPRLLYSSPPTSGSLVAQVGNTVTLQCVFRANPSPQTRWYKDEIRVQERDSHLKFQSANQSLHFVAVKRSDEGQYRCEATNSQGHSHIVEFNLLIHEKPYFVNRPSSMNVTEGDTLTMACPLGGLPKPTLEWFSNGSPLQELLAAKPDHLILRKDRLTFVNITSDLTMTLTCKGNNSNGEAVANFYVNVHEPTVITQGPSDVFLRGQKVIRFGCTAKTDPGLPLMITWYRGQNSHPITPEKERVFIDEDSSLVLNLTSEEDGGRSFIANYACVVSNGVMSVNASARLRPGSEAPLGNLVRPLLSISGPFPSDFIWVAICLLLAAGAALCLSLVCYIRRRHKDDMRARLGTDGSDMAEFATTEEQGEGAMSPCCDQEGGLTHVACVSDSSLRDRVKEVFIERDRVQLSLLIGKGQFGRVYSAVLLESKGKSREQVAVKTLKYKAEETEMVDLFLKEALMMRDFRHRHVLSLIGIAFDLDGSPMVVLPFMEQGDLRRYILNPSMDITVLELLKLGLQVTRGMVYLSSMRFVHRDLAARNCMVDLEGVVKVADFGLSRELFKRDYYRLEDGKTPLPIRWMAPECLDRNVFTTMSDVWSLGVLLWELMTRGAVPYPEVDNWDIPTYIQTNRRLPQPAYCPYSVYEIMQHTWADDPSRRPTFQELVGRLETIIRAAHRPGSPGTGTGTATLAHLYTNVAAPVAPLADYRQTVV